MRTALKHLVSTGEITDEGNSQYRIITVVKYDDYQRDNRPNNSQSTDDQQTINRRITDDQQQYKKDNNVIREQWNNVSNALIADADAHEIQSEQNRVLDAAEDAGFKMSNDVRTSLIALYADFGLEKMLEGMKSCVKHGAVNLAYLEAVLKGKPKKKVESFPQRDYSGVQDEMMANLAREMAEFQAKEVV